MITTKPAQILADMLEQRGLDDSVLSEPIRRTTRAYYRSRKEERVCLASFAVILQEAQLILARRALMRRSHVA